MEHNISHVFSGPSPARDTVMRELEELAQTSEANTKRFEDHTHLALVGSLGTPPPSLSCPGY